MSKRDAEIKNEFFKFLNSQCKLTDNEENLILEMNQIITYSLASGVNINYQPINLENKYENIFGFNNEQSEMQIELKSKLDEISANKNSLISIKTEIEKSFDKLRYILESRNELSSILKDFNSSAKTIIQDKEKITKLTNSIEKISRLYDDTKSILAFFENTKEEVVEKMRFIGDYEEIENGISFFTLNTNYVEAENYLNTYNMLKRIAITRYYQYMSHTLENFFFLFDGYIINDEFFNHILNLKPKNIDIKFFNFPKNYEKMQIVQVFFEKKSKNDYDVKKAIEGIKNNFIKQRTGMLKPFYEEIFQSIKKRDITNVSQGSNVIYSSLSEIFKYTICEVFYFSCLFQTNISDNMYILASLLNDLFDNLYNTLRPIIVNSQSLEELFTIFDGFLDNFLLFFLETEYDDDVNDTRVIKSDKETQKLEEKEKILFFFSNIHENNFNSQILEQNMDKIFDFMKICKILIRPNITRLIQDIQEQIFFKTNQHIKSNLIDIESEFVNFLNYEEKISKNYKHFPLFHFFLRKMSILMELLRNKLDKKVLNEFTVICIEKFIFILNDEIIAKKTLTYDFEIYIMQQIILAIKLIEEFQIDAIDTEIEVDFYSITDIFTNNFTSFSGLANLANIKEMIMNSAPKIFDKTRNFKKILYNNLLKSYKIFINLVNEKTFGREVIEFIYKIRNSEAKNPNPTIVPEINTNSIQSLNFVEMYANYEKILVELSNQVRIIDPSITNKLTASIIKNLNSILKTLKGNIQNEEVKSLLETEEVNNNFEKIKESLFNN